MLPSTVVTVIVVIPGATAVILPPDTVATLLSSDFHDTFLLLALSGITEAVTSLVSPSFKGILERLTLTPVTATLDGVGIGDGLGSLLGPESPPQEMKAKQSNIVNRDANVFFIDT